MGGREACRFTPVVAGSLTRSCRRHCLATMAAVYLTDRLECHMANHLDLTLSHLDDIDPLLVEICKTVSDAAGPDAVSTLARIGNLCRCIADCAAFAKESLA